MDLAHGVVRRLARRLATTLSVGVTRDAACRAQAVGFLDDRLQCRADLWVFEQSPHSYSDDVVDAVISREGECSQKSVLALRESQSQSLQWFF